MNELIDIIESKENMKTIFVGNTMYRQNPKKCKKKQLPSKPPTNRVVTKEKKWIRLINDDDTKIQSQNTLLDDIEIPSEKQGIILREIKNKIRGYKQQDIEKQKYEEDSFVTLNFVIDMLRDNSTCYYCKTRTKILYDISRDPLQWTLERINNAQGHNKNNVKICCLSCNIKRRTMYHEKYLFTKQLILKKDK